MRTGLILCLGVLAGLPGCGPLSVDQAERVCLERARDAVQPRGEASVGLGVSGGDIRPVGGFEISVTSDYLKGRDPSEVYAQCVVQRSGKPARRPLEQHPGWGRP